MDNLKWWEGNVDEILIGLAIAAVAIAAIIFIPDKGDTVAVAAITALGAYLGIKGKTK